MTGGTAAKAGAGALKIKIKLPGGPKPPASQTGTAAGSTVGSTQQAPSSSTLPAGLPPKVNLLKQKAKQLVAASGAAGATPTGSADVSPEPSTSALAGGARGKKRPAPEVISMLSDDLEDDVQMVSRRSKGSVAASKPRAGRQVIIDDDEDEDGYGAGPSPNVTAAAARESKPQGKRRRVSSRRRKEQDEDEEVDGDDDDDLEPDLEPEDDDYGGAWEAEEDEEQDADKVKKTRQRYAVSRGCGDRHKASRRGS